MHRGSETGVPQERVSARSLRRNPLGSNWLVALPVIVLAVACGGGSRSAAQTLACVNAVGAYQSVPDDATDLERRAAKDKLDAREARALKASQAWFAKNGAEATRLAEEAGVAVHVDPLAAETTAKLDAAKKLSKEGDSVLERECAK